MDSYYTLIFSSLLTFQDIFFIQICFSALFLLRYRYFYVMFTPLFVPLLKICYVKKTV